MRVFELISPTGYYGAERVLVTLAKYLQKAGAEVVAGIFSGHPGSYDVMERAGEAGVAVFQVPCGSRVDLGAVRTLRRQIRGMRASVVHTHGYKTDLYARLACWGLGVPLVATYHHGTDRHHREEWTMRLYDKLDCQALRIFDHVVAVSDPIKAFLEQAGVSERKLSVILNGIDLESFQENAEATLRRDLSLGSLRTVGMVGRLHPEKGPQRLLAAAQKVLDQLPDVIFVIVGDGPQRGELDDLARTLGIERSVRFAGVRTDIAGVYSSCDVVVLPSLNEGLPMTLLEAMAMRRPVVATDVGGVSAVVKNGETGVLLASADPQEIARAIVELIQNPVRADRLARNGQDLVKARYSAERMTREYLDIFRQVCGER